ncbi:ketopantoate hydroxymethyltransferase-domain-containing protein [Multifurca ochricompacta]|uniref:3-methyl-2-oxobutanoate hydroxymethyltransferase n=1 Tax=Multifurca ochricompacta TaxID=376703 RepID=A0AAD4M4L5_9AGAM|nr:ketopantoate hydroxymethyltransferase-domain-containing protein [Multifurca ochricompacta]
MRGSLLDCTALKSGSVRRALVGRRWMSVRPMLLESGVPPTLPSRKKMTIQQLYQMRRVGTPITMLTAYDFPTARALDTHGIDIALVGDSLAQVCLGLPSTTRLSLDEMLHHTRAVARGTVHPFLVADMPFGSYHTSPEDAVRSAVRMVQDGHVEAVKLEGGPEIAATVRRISEVGVPVMAHVGLMPQRHAALSGYRVQGRDAASAKAVLDGALALQDAGAFAIVLEAIPHRLAEYMTAHLNIPTIGIGAGPGTSGQVLVWDDVMTRWHGKKAKFVRRFADVGHEEGRGVQNYIGAVRDGSFPNSQTEGYEMAGGEWECFLEQIGDNEWRGMTDKVQERQGDVASSEGMTPPRLAQAM